MDELFKCGYCGWLLNSQCENECIRKIFNKAIYHLVAHDNKALTVVEKENGTKVVVTDEDTLHGSSWEEGFIKNVQDRPSLYNLRLPLMERTNSKKNQLWAEISNIYGGKFSPADLQKKWKYLRDCFMRAKNKMTAYKPSGPAAQPIPDPKFRHYELMKFVDDGQSEQVRVSSIEPSPLASGMSSPIPLLQGEMLSPSTPAKRKRTGEKRDLEKGILADLSTTPAQDGVDGFLIRLGESLRRSPYRERALLEIKILQLVYDVENKVDTNP